MRIGRPCEAVSRVVQQHLSIGRRQKGGLNKNSRQRDRRHQVVSDVCHPLVTASAVAAHHQ